MFISGDLGLFEILIVFLNLLHRDLGYCYYVILLKRMILLKIILFLQIKSLAHWFTIFLEF